MTISTTIDWLSFTTHKEIKNETLLSMLDYNSAIPETARFGYTTAHRFASGLVVMSNSGRIDMGRHWVLSGSCLQEITNTLSKTVFEILRIVVQEGAKVTRLDLAKDARSEAIELTKIFSAIQTGSYSGKTKTFSQISDTKGGHTIYIGSRSSERFARLYHKGAQLGTGEDWIRFEIEMKGDVAKEAARSLVGGSYAPGQLFDGIAKGMCVVASPHYIRFFGRDDAIGLPKIEKQVDRETWIREQVIHAVVEHYTQFPDSKAVNDLIVILNRIRELGR